MDPAVKEAANSARSALGAEYASAFTGQAELVRIMQVAQYSRGQLCATC